ncbi:MAG TPA: hypothetical protein VGG69_09900 [Rhizomicrobium sp.]
MTFRARLAFLAFTALLVASGAAAAGPLSVADVNAPDINCVFNTTCTVVVTDTSGHYPPSSGYTGKPRLITRTFAGGPGAQGDGLTAYEYRVDFRNAQAATDINCAINLKVNTGRIQPLNYDGRGPKDVYVITSGGIGSIALSSATKSGPVVTFTFTTPVCPENGVNAPGQSSFWFGFAAKGVPLKRKAFSDLTYGGGTVNVAARAPTH